MREPESEGLVTVAFEPDGDTVRTPPGVSVLEAAVVAGNNVRSECGGDGECGKCRVVVKDRSALTGMTIHEGKLLSSMTPGRAPYHHRLGVRDGFGGSWDQVSSIFSSRCSARVESGRPSGGHPPPQCIEGADGREPSSRL
jgi:ferredoxin